MRMMRQPSRHAVSAHQSRLASLLPPKPDRKVRAPAAQASAVPVRLGVRPPRKPLPTANTSHRTRSSIFERKIPRISEPTREPLPLNLSPCQRNAPPLRPFPRVTLAFPGTALSFRFLDGRWRRRAQMVVNDFQRPALVALKNLRRSPVESIAILAPPVFACLAGMKSVGVRSYRYIAC